jgi:hypothetical protein
VESHLIASIPEWLGRSVPFRHWFPHPLLLKVCVCRNVVLRTQQPVQQHRPNRVGEGAESFIEVGA